MDEKQAALKNSVGIATKDSAPVAGEIDLAQNYLDNLEAAINMLESKLSPVMGDDYPKEGADPHPPRGQSGLYSVLAKQNSRIKSMADWVSNIASRVEL